MFAFFFKLDEGTKTCNISQDFFLHQWCFQILLNGTTTGLNILKVLWGAWMGRFLLSCNTSHLFEILNKMFLFMKKQFTNSLFFKLYEYSKARGFFQFCFYYFIEENDDFLPFLRSKRVFLICLQSVDELKWAVYLHL